MYIQLAPAPPPFPPLRPQRLPPARVCSLLAEASPPYALRLDTFHHGGVDEIEFHDLPDVIDIHFVGMNKFIEQEGKRRYFSCSKGGLGLGTACAFSSWRNRRA